MIRRCLRPLLPAVVLALFASVASASDDWHFSAFGTLGALWQDDNELFFNHPAQSRERAHRPDLGTDSQLGLQIMRRLGDRADLTLQILAADKYRERYTPQVSWAFIRFNPSPSLTLRAGRLRAPFFMYSDSLNVNYTYLWARPPVEVYGLNPFADIDGVDLLFTRRMGTIDVEAQTFFGRGKHKFPDGEAKLTNTAGFNLSLANGNLTAQLGYAHGRLSIRYGDPLFQIARQELGGDSSRLAGSGASTSFASLGLRWDDGTLQLIGEIARRNASRYVAPATGWHLTSAYRIGQFTPFITLARQQQSDSVVPKTAAPSFINAYLASRNNSQRSLTLGVRWDTTTNTALKLQATRSKIDSDAWGAQFPHNLTNGTSPAGRTVDMLSLSVDFVF